MYLILMKLLLRIGNITVKNLLLIMEYLKNKQLRVLFLLYLNIIT